MIKIIYYKVGLKGEIEKSKICTKEPKKNIKNQKNKDQIENINI
jgi:hypothetical protein